MVELVVTSKTGTGMFGQRPVAAVATLRYNLYTTFNPQKDQHYIVTNKPKIGSRPDYESKKSLTSPKTSKA